MFEVQCFERVQYFAANCLTFPSWDWPGMVFGAESYIWSQPMFEGDRERERKQPVVFLCEITHPSHLPAAAQAKREANGQESPGNCERGSDNIALSCPFLPFFNSVLWEGLGDLAGRQAGYMLSN